MFMLQVKAYRQLYSFVTGCILDGCVVAVWVCLGHAGTLIMTRSPGATQ